jgi:hypothetical protein
VAEAILFDEAAGAPVQVRNGKAVGFVRGGGNDGRWKLREVCYTSVIWVRH